MIANPRDSQLDGWRAISALAVILVHAALYRLELQFASLSEAIRDFDVIGLVWQIALRWVYGIGTSGVPIFFMISGYIITTLLDKEEKRHGNVSLGGFYIRRTLRIMPPMFLYVAVIFALSHFGMLEVSGKTLAAASGFGCNIVQCDWFLAHYWSLAYEEQFYLVWPILFLLFASHRLPIAMSATVIAIIAALVFPYLQALAFLAIGVSFALLRIKYAISIPSFVAPASLAVLLVLMLLPEHGLWVRVTEALDLLLLPALFFSSMFNLTFQRMIGAAWLAAIGRASYGLYLWQQLFLAPRSEIHAALSGFEILLLPLVVYLSYTYLELPLISLGRTFSERLRARKA